MASMGILCYSPRIKTTAVRTMTHKRVMIGMSGGVDSSVAALHLLEQGYEVHGLFMKNWEEDDDQDYCAAATDMADAEAVCAQLDIPFHAVNFASEYWDQVFSHFLQEYQAGRTPNPDVLCNKEIKFKAFLDHALNLGMHAIATGHYANIEITQTGVQLHKGLDSNKDQSYFLHRLNQHQLKHSLFPIGRLEKSTVRDIANQQSFDNFNKKDSTGICFIGERRFKTFLSQYLPHQPGDIEDTEGHRVGQHDGLMYHTFGQRQGLGIGGTTGGAGTPWYVVDKDLKRNVLIVAQGKHHPRLFQQGLSATEMHWIGHPPPKFPFTCCAKIRYRQADQACEILAYCPDTQQCQVTFEESQRAITPGQSIVFYLGSQCLGGGIIQWALK